MIFSKITQNGLTLTTDTTAIPAQYSNNIQFQFIQDTKNYSGYTPSVCVALYDSSLIECADILKAGGEVAIEDGIFSVGNQILYQSGYLAVGITLTSGQENVTLPPVVYKVSASLGGLSPLPPDSGEWQQVVEAYVNTFLTNNVPTKAEIEDLQGSIDDIIDGTTTVGNATNAENATNATNATTAGNATNLGGEPASKYVTTEQLNEAISEAVSEALASYCPHKVGDIYSTINDTNPGTIWSGTTWVQWGEGRVPVGVDTSDPDFNTVEKTGGEKEHTLTVDEIPNHKHNLNQGFTGMSQISGNFGYYMIAGVEGNAISSTGNDQPHNNLQPYITCYMWKRTA